MARADHIKVYRGGYYHHGIDLGDGTVIHFSGEFSGEPGRKKEAVVRRSSMAEFLHNDTQYEVVAHPAKEQLHPDLVVLTAFSRLGQRGTSYPPTTASISRTSARRAKLRAPRCRSPRRSSSSTPGTG